MAGTQDPNENPVGINVVPMVDVIFCLCVFFMCSMKFKELEGKFESWLPQDKGLTNEVPPDMPIEEIRVALYWDAAKAVTLRQFGRTWIQNDEQLQALLEAQYAGYLQLGKPETPCIIDAAELVPWNEVVNVINLAKRVKIDKIQFAAGRNYEAQGAPALKK
jgi:biopolymer transport protein ExbD